MRIKDETREREKHAIHHTTRFMQVLTFTKMTVSMVT